MRAHTKRAFRDGGNVGATGSFQQFTSGFGQRRRKKIHDEQGFDVCSPQRSLDRSHAVSRSVPCFRALAGNRFDRRGGHRRACRGNSPHRVVRSLLAGPHFAWHAGLRSAGHTVSCVAWPDFANARRPFVARRHLSRRSDDSLGFGRVATARVTASIRMIRPDMRGATALAHPEHCVLLAHPGLRQ